MAITPTITREIIDRRQPTIRWSAVIGGALVALGVWSVLQLLGLGASLAAIDPAQLRTAHGAAVGAGGWSVIAPLVATLVAGYLAVRLASVLDRRVAIEHGLIVWGLSTAAGVAMTFGIAAAVHGGRAGQAALPAGDAPPGEAVFRDAWIALAPINYGLHVTGKPQIAPEDLVDAARAAADDEGLDRDAFVTELATRSGLSRDDARTAADRLVPTARRLAERTVQITPEERRALVTAERVGRGMVALAVSILLSIGTAILGALVALRRQGRAGRRDGHITAPYPVATPANDDGAS